MGLFNRLFGKNIVRKSLLDELDEAAVELEIDFDDESEDLDENDYKFNHCFIFYGLNEEAFGAIENQVNDFDGPHHLSLLRGMEGVLMAELCGQSAGSEKVKKAMKTDDDSVAYVNQRLNQYLEAIKEQFDSQIGEDCLKHIDKERPYIVENIRCAMKVWSESEFFEKENFIGALIVFARSSKEFDRKDEISENQNGMNLPLVASGGFLRTCIFATEDILNVEYPDSETIEGKFWKEVTGSNPRNEWNYGPTSYYKTPFGFNYFDQDGQLWRISDVSKSVELASEWKEDFINNGDDEGEYYISH